MIDMKNIKVGDIIKVTGPVDNNKWEEGDIAEVLANDYLPGYLDVTYKHGWKIGNSSKNAWRIEQKHVLEHFPKAPTQEIPDGTYWVVDKELTSDWWEIEVKDGQAQWFIEGDRKNVATAGDLFTAKVFRGEAMFHEWRTEHPAPETEARVEDGTYWVTGSGRTWEVTAKDGKNKWKVLPSGDEVPASEGLLFRTKNGQEDGLEFHTVHPDPLLELDKSKVYLSKDTSAYPRNYDILTSFNTKKNVWEWRFKHSHYAADLTNADSETLGEVLLGTESWEKPVEYVQTFAEKHKLVKGTDYQVKKKTSALTFYIRFVNNEWRYSAIRGMFFDDSPLIDDTHWGTYTDPVESKPEPAPKPELENGTYWVTSNDQPRRFWWKIVVKDGTAKWFLRGTGTPTSENYGYAVSMSKGDSVRNTWHTREAGRFQAQLTQQLDKTKTYVSVSADGDSDDDIITSFINGAWEWSFKSSKLRHPISTQSTVDSILGLDEWHAPVERIEKFTDKHKFDESKVYVIRNKYSGNNYFLKFMDSEKGPGKDWFYASREIPTRGRYFANQTTWNEDSYTVPVEYNPTYAEKHNLDESKVYLVKSKITSMEFYMSFVEGEWTYSIDTPINKHAALVDETTWSESGYEAPVEFESRPVWKVTLEAAGHTTKDRWLNTANGYRQRINKRTGRWEFNNGDEWISFGTVDRLLSNITENPEVWSKLPRKKK